MFSYALSMIPRWERAIDRAIEAVRPGGILAVVDFSEQRELPAWFRAGLRRWLDLFDVHPNAAITGYLAALASPHRGRFRGAADLSRLRLPAALQEARLTFLRTS